MQLKSSKKCKLYVSLYFFRVCTLHRFQSDPFVANLHPLNECSTVFTAFDCSYLSRNLTIQEKKFLFWDHWNVATKFYIFHYHLFKKKILKIYGFSMNSRSKIQYTVLDEIMVSTKLISSICVITSKILV